MKTFWQWIYFLSFSHPFHEVEMMAHLIKRICFPVLVYFVDRCGTNPSRFINLPDKCRDTDSVWKFDALLTRWIPARSAGSPNSTRLWARKPTSCCCSTSWTIPPITTSRWCAPAKCRFISTANSANSTRTNTLTMLLKSSPNRKPYKCPAASNTNATCPA